MVVTIQLSQIGGQDVFIDVPAKDAKAACSMRFDLRFSRTELSTCPGCSALDQANSSARLIQKLDPAMESTLSSLAPTLQIAGWLLTALGQIQIALKLRQGFLTWIAANTVLIVLSVCVGLWWSIGMYLTNVAVCVWSYRRWQNDAQPIQPLVMKRKARWSGSP